MKYTKLLYAGILIFFVLMHTSGFSATTITIDFSSLPSTQGWLYEHSTTGSHADTTEAGMFSLSSGVLNGNTIGEGLVSPSGAGYNHYTPLSDTDYWQLKWRMQVVNYENTGFYSGAYLIVNNGTNDVGFFLGENDFRITDGAGSQTYLLDVNNYHDYQLNYTPGGLGTWELFVDSGSFATGSGAAFSRANALGFGDGTGAANAEWNMTEYSFTYDAAPVPVPATIFLLGPGLIGLIGFKRKLNKK